MIDIRCIFGHDWRGHSVEIDGDHIRLLAKSCYRCGHQQWLCVWKNVTMMSDDDHPGVFYFDEAVHVRGFVGKTDDWLVKPVKPAVWAREDDEHE